MDGAVDQLRGGEHGNADIMMDGHDGYQDDMEADYGDEMDGVDGMPMSPSAADLNQEELEAIIESISSGKCQQYKKLQF